MTESPMSRESRLAEAFVTLADTLVTDFDIADLFHDLAGACVELLEVTAAGTDVGRCQRPVAGDVLIQ